MTPWENCVLTGFIFSFLNFFLTMRRIASKLCISPLFRAVVGFLRDIKSLGCFGVFPSARERHHGLVSSFFLFHFRRWCVRAVASVPPASFADVVLSVPFPRLSRSPLSRCAEHTCPPRSGLFAFRRGRSTSPVGRFVLHTEAVRWREKRE